ncbi:glycosyltransferase family 2 protein [Microbacterium awajiense]|uniref:Glycosyltransferase family 2 protein n=1 Tax=Microbacterium awajiense TaxID=415214 RepID=A0ABP7AFL9_9MICO
MVSVSVVVCAYTLDRWDQLALAMASLRSQEPAHDTVLVIDHNPQLLERARRAWPEATVLANSGRQGLSAARNTALNATTAEVVAFLDDDAYARPGWLATLVAPFADPAVVAVGGSAEPIWPGATPAVLPPELLWVVGCSYRGLPQESADVRNVMGCSMAFRRAPLVGIGAFNPDTGRVGRRPIGCEETEACIRLRQQDAGAIIRYEPTATVGHHVSADRTTMKYVVHRGWCEGLSKAALARTIGRRDALSDESVYARRVLPAGVARELRAGRLRGAAAIVLCLGATTLGYVRGLAAQIQPGAVRDELAIGAAA